MAATTSHRNAAPRATAKRELETSPKESPPKLAEDLVEYLIAYARENPGYAALGCIGVGFVLGWKLKPW
jgi:hypothetical protein